MESHWKPIWNIIDVKHRTGQFQTVVTAVISNSSLIDGLDVVVQEPGRRKEEIAYLKATFHIRG